MTSTEQLYVAVQPTEYNTGKATILQCQASILHILRRYQTLQLLWKEKKLLRSKLNKVFNTAIKNIDESTNNMPMPKAVLKRIEQEQKEREERKKKQQAQKEKEEKEKRKQEQTIRKKTITKKKKNSIDEELAEIQRKLNTLTR
jgi:septal ring factor EnvC (AmiA/AmiB activator)